MQASAMLATLVVFVLSLAWGWRRLLAVSIGFTLLATMVCAWQGLRLAKLTGVALVMFGGCWLLILVGWVMRRVQGLFEKNKLPLRYKRHPDPKQEAFFFGLLRECLDAGLVSEATIRDEMAQDHVRHDALKLLERTPALAA